MDSAVYFKNKLDYIFRNIVFVTVNPLDTV